jgi:hypothetical protein
MKGFNHAIRVVLVFALIFIVTHSIWANQNPATPELSRNSISFQSFEIVFIETSPEAVTTVYNPGLINSQKDNFIENLYPNIDLHVISMPENEFAFQWFVRPGGNPENIRFEFHRENEKATVKNSNGDLIVNLKDCIIKIHGLRAFQGIQQISCAFIPDGSYIGLQTGDYDPAKTLIIDPMVTTLMYSSFFGGNSDDVATDLAIDINGDIIVSGFTNSVDFPMTATGFDTSYNGGANDVFVCKFDNTLTTLLGSTFIGGINDEKPESLQLDGQGNVYLAIRTKSPDLPVTANAFKDTINIDSSRLITELYAVKLNGDLSQVVSASYIWEVETGSYGQVACMLDNKGNIYFTGSTPHKNFPVGNTGFDTSFSGAADGFILRMDTAFATVKSGTFIGDSLEDHLFDMYFDGSDLFVTGMSKSPGFPIAGNPYQDTLIGGFDIVVCRLNADLSVLKASTFFGKIDFDRGIGISEDNNGNLLITAQTNSDSLPLGTGVIKDTIFYGDGNTKNDMIDVYLATLTKDLDAVLNGTYFGGENIDYAFAQASDASGFIYLGGETYSENFRVSPDAFDTSFGGQTEGFISKVSADFTLLPESGFLGGLKNEHVAGVALNANDEVFITGTTNSDDFPLSDDANDTIKKGNTDIFLMKTSMPATGIQKPADPVHNAFIAGEYLVIDLNNLAYTGYEIYDLQGRMIMQNSMGLMPQGQSRFQLQNLQNGYYLVRVRMGNEIKTLKWVNLH